MLINDSDAVGFTFDGENLCRWCTRDVLSDIVIGNAYRLDTEDMGILDLLRVCSEFTDEDMVSGEFYVTDAYDSGDYPKPFEGAEPGEECMNPECGKHIQTVYFVNVLIS